MRFVKLCSLVFLLAAALLSGCLGVEDASVRSKPAPASGALNHSPAGEARTGIEGVSDKLERLKNRKGWSDLAYELGRSKTTTVLWYHLRTRSAVDPKVVFE
ncbi:MAG: hypothetical protein ACXQTM_06605 [Methanosarcinales archaeon]